MKEMIKESGNNQNKKISTRNSVYLKDWDLEPGVRSEYPLGPGTPRLVSPKVRGVRNTGQGSGAAYLPGDRSQESTLGPAGGLCCPGEEEKLCWVDTKEAGKGTLLAERTQSSASRRAPDLHGLQQAPTLLTSDLIPSPGPPA